MIQRNMDNIPVVPQLSPYQTPTPLQPSPQTNQHSLYEQYTKLLSLSFGISKYMISTYHNTTQLIRRLQQIQDNIFHIKANAAEEFLNSGESQAGLRRGGGSGRQASRKRSRRMADEIQRRHRCMVEFCEKQYGSQGSLLQHIKLKHPQAFHTTSNPNPNSKNPS